MDILEAIRNRRSIRNFAPDAPSREEIEALIGLADRSAECGESTILVILRHYRPRASRSDFASHQGLHDKS